MRLPFSFPLAVLAVAGCHEVSSPAPSPSPPPSMSSSTVPADSPAVAVVELFTSEGCSSCPRADVLLNELAREGDPRVLTLAFHVDYWDSLGWRDRFASPSYADRQRTYAASLGESGVYTPEMIVNGTEAFTGSDRSHARAAIARALAAPSRARLELTPQSPAGDAGSVDVRYLLDGAPAGSVLELALVEDGLGSKVLAGENAGRTLRHESVVRAFVSRTVGGGKEEGTLTLRTNRTSQADPAVSWDHAGLVGLVHAPAAPGEGEPVIAAGRARLDQGGSER